MSTQILSIDIQPRQSGPASRPATEPAPVIRPDRLLSLPGLLEVLAGGARSGEGDRDIVASAMCTALKVVTAHEFPSLSVVLEGQREDLRRRANRCQARELPLAGHVTELPFLALCAAVHRHGFVDADGKEARSKLFLALIDLVAFCPDLFTSSSFRNVGAGLRLLVERLAKSPTAGITTRHFSAWQLFDWVEDHGALADYVQRGVRQLRRHLVLAWRATVRLDTEAGSDDDEEGAAIPEATAAGETVWSLTETTQYQCELPPGLHKKLLSNELTRVTALARYASASPLNLSDADMGRDVTRLTEEIHRDPSSSPHALAQLLSIATGTPVADAYRIGWDDGGISNAAPAYPGVLTEDGRWLVRSEFNPRQNEGEEFLPRAVHQPIPEPLAALLLAQTGGSRAGLPAIAILSGAKLPASPRVESAWFTTYASRLMRDTRFGISVAQHVLHSSLGVDTAPVFYDRIPANHIAHSVARATHPWFGCASRPPAKGMPSHCVGSQRVVEKSECKAFMQGLRAGWSNALPLPDRIHRRCRNLRFALVLAVAHRTNESITRITRASIDRASHLITVSDKAVGPDHPHRPATLGRRLVRELDELLAELSLAIREYPGTALAQAAERILSGSQSLFLHVDSADDCRPVNLDRHLADSPLFAQDIRNWCRHLANDELGTRVPESLRVAQLGWHGTRCGTISDLAVLAPLTVFGRLSVAVDNMLSDCGWAPLPPSGLAPAVERLPPVFWTEATRNHQRAFETALERLDEAADGRRGDFVLAVLPGVNAFFLANDIALTASEEGLLLRGPTSPIPVGREMHQLLLRVMGGEGASGLSARELLHDWIRSARHRKVVAGPVPRRIVRVRPRQAGPFVEQAHRSLEHRDDVLAAAHGAELSAASRTFLTVLLEGWIPDAGVVLDLLHPGALLHDLDDDTLLIEASRCASARGTKGVTGCLAFNGAAALALRAWHRSGKVAIPDGRGIRSEIHGALADVLAPEISPEDICVELEALMRANLSLRCPGLVRDVVLRRVIPSFAPISRVIALHENDPVCPLEPPALPQAGIANGVRKSRARRSMHGYNQVKDILAQLANRWTPGNDSETRGEAIAALRLLVPDGISKTGVHIIALYAASYLTEGLHRALVRPVTVQDAVYSVGHALLDALPEQADLSRRDLWQAAYARALDSCPAEDRHRLARDLTHFQKVMAREFDLPFVGLAPLLVALDVPSPPEPVGFLTESERTALVWFANFRLEGRAAEGSPAHQQEALRALAVTSLALSSSMRDREVRLPQVKDWHALPGEDPHVVLRTNGQDFVKSNAGRRTLRPSGRFSTLAIATLRQLVALKQSRSGFQPREKLLLPSRDCVADAEDLDAVTQINADIRYITGCREAALDTTRKTWALRSFVAIGADHNDLWTMRDYLSEIGHAGIGMTLGHYVHDPVALLARMPTGSGPSPRHSGWILGMVPKAAKHLMEQDRSWLSPRSERHSPPGANVLLLPAVAPQDSFEPTLAATASLLGLVAEGQSVESATRMLAWPISSVSRVKSALADLRERDVVVSTSSAPDTHSLAPPSRRHTHEALAQCSSEAHRWRELTWIFETWLSDWNALVLKGFIARMSDWDRNVPKSSPIRRLPWKESKKGPRTFFELPGARAHEHSAWPELRWMALSAWLVERLRK
jgi:hypothetical protein